MRSGMYIYTYACHEDEESLCLMELRSLFGSGAAAAEADCRMHDSGSARIFHSELAVDPSRSPFLKERIEVLSEGDSPQEIAEWLQSGNVQLGRDVTFKVRFVKTNDLDGDRKIDYSGQRAIERDIGRPIRGKADMNRPDRLFGIVPYRGRWYFGACADNEAVWLRHIEKPQQYTMALPARTARAIVNIAVPDPSRARVIDPCCGIGTVLVEALSMGIAIVGRDINPLVVRGARANLAHFGLNAEVALGSIADVTEHYDVAIVDMPYNIVSKVSREDSMTILRHARRIAGRILVIAIEPIDDQLADAGFTVLDGCVARKSSFTRHIRLCQ